MANQTVGDVFRRTRSHLADVELPDGEEFTDVVLTEPFCSAYEEITTKAAIWSLPDVKRSLLVTLTPGTKTLPIFQADFGKPYMVEERELGSGSRFRLVNQVTDLTDRDPGASLNSYEFEDDEIKTNGATTTREVKVSYYASGAAPTDPATLIGYQGAVNFLALKTAALVLEGREEGGSLSMRLEQRAKAAMEDFIQLATKQQNSIRIVRPPFSSGGRRFY